MASQPEWWKSYQLERTTYFARLSTYLPADWEWTYDATLFPDGCLGSWDWETESE